MRIRIPRCRLFSGRCLAVLFLVAGFIVYCYYYNSFQLNIGKQGGKRLSYNEPAKLKASPEYHHEIVGRQKESLEYCPILDESSADIDTVMTYPLFEFQPIWLRTKEFWDKSFEERYEKLRNNTNRPKLKVIVVPHSHNDPGWLKTFEQYFEWKTKHIINNIVQKLHQYPNMTFIWTEISFLNAWWERSHPVKQKAFKKLIKEGRLEITTGGWVMPDEACTHIYSLIDQFLEGHLWVKNNLDTTPKIGWSIDPFGHGPTVPYLLDQSGLEGTVIQRIHYAWKQWLAEKQIEEFYWLPGWNVKRQPSLIVHNQPFDIYSIKSSCGPHPSICLGYDFRRIPGEYSEYSTKQQDITNENLHDKSRTLLEEYDRIGSLTAHNVVLVPLGDDFRYEYAVEFDAQYSNYMKMFEYINSHKDQFRAEVHFGTPLDYFNAVKERLKTIPTLRGDFFIYSDIFSEGKPAYWSGYYTTRPYLKILARQFEHQLRTAEILFSLVSNHIKQMKNPKLLASEKRLEKSYEQLINARRNLGLFQHHDAITGTSKANVMYDYGTKLFTSIYHCIRLQETALTSTLIPNEKLHSQNILQSESEWESYGKLVKKMQITIVDNKTIILFNPLVEPRTEVVTITTNSTDVRVYDTFKKKYVMYQVTPNIDLRQDGKHVISEDSFDLLFVASLPPLTAVTYTLERHVNRTNHCAVFCNNCQRSSGAQNFKIQKMMPGDIQLENSVLKLLIGRNTGFLRQIYRKDIKKRNVVEMQFSAYQSAQRHSGAYLFMPDYDYPERNVLAAHTNSNAIDDENIVIVSGPISTEITSLYLPFLIHTVRIYNVDDYALSRGVYVESIVDFESPPKNRDTELFVRIQTDIQNGEVPEFYTDQNGFQYQKRVKVEKLGIEGNYYPITTMAWLQDEDSRLTWITNHAQGASSFEPGRLEIMLDRRTLYDDFRGIGEGVVDNKPTVFQNWLLLESVPKRSGDVRTEHASRDGPKLRLFTEKKRPNARGTSSYQLPSKTADYLSRSLNYPVNVYLLDTTDAGEVDVNSHRIFVENFPTGVHLVTLRTITDKYLEQFPSSSCFMILQRPGYSCDVGEDRVERTSKFSADTRFTGLNYTNVTSVSLTGLKTYSDLNTLRDIELEPMEIKTYKITF